MIVIIVIVLLDYIIAICYYDYIVVNSITIIRPVANYYYSR